MVTTVPAKPKLFSRAQPTSTLLPCSISFFLPNIKNLSSSSALGWQLWLLTWDCDHLGTKFYLHLSSLPWRCSSSLLLFSWTRIVYSQLHLLQQQRQRSAALLGTCVRWFLPSRPIVQYSNLHFQHDCYICPCLCSWLFHGQACCPLLRENSLFQWLTMYWGGRWCLNLP